MLTLRGSVQMTQLSSLISETSMPVLGGAIGQIPAKNTEIRARFAELERVLGRLPAVCQYAAIVGDEKAVYGEWE